MCCKLCLENKKLCDSHIIPEFLFKSLYDEKHRLFEISTVKEQRDKIKQKGLREKLLCQECESQFSIYEKHVREVLYGGAEILIKPENGELIVSNIDYKKFKLFLLSIIWRASISKNPFFNNVSLGDHENKIHLMLINQNPGLPSQYGCFILYLLNDKGEPFDELIMSPEKAYLDNHRVYRFIMGGATWFFVVSKHSENIPFKDKLLSEDGIYKIGIIKMSEISFFNKLMKNLIESRK